MGPDERIPEDWFAKQVAFADRTDGDIDTLANRIAHIRTWTFVSNRADWLKDPAHWQAKTREIEDRLSDALHEQLTQRFVDRRTSALMKGMRDKDELHAEIADDGAIHVENHFVGRLKGFRFQLDPGRRRHSRQGDAQCRRAGARARAGHARPPRRRRAARRAVAQPSRPHPVARRGDRPDRGHRRSVEADGVAARRRASVRARPREGAGAPRSLADADDRRQAEAARRDRQGRGHRRARARHRLPPAREPRRAAARDGGRRDQDARSERRARSCANTACASAPSTSTSRSS